MGRIVETPMMLFERGIVTGDWAPVVKAFNIMFGYSPQPSAKVENDVLPRAEELVNQLFHLFSGEKSAGEDEPLPSPKLRKQPVKKRTVEKKTSVASVAAEEVDDGDDDGVPSAPPTKRRPSRQLRKANATSEDDDDDDDDDDDMSGGTGTVQCTSRRFQPGSFRNEFQDDGTIAANLIGESQAISAVAKPKKRRREVQMVSKRCSVCNQKEKVPAEIGGLLRDSLYRCNSCVGGGGR